MNEVRPLNPDVDALVAFARRFLDPEDLGHAVDAEVRQAARRALGLPQGDEHA